MSIESSVYVSVYLRDGRFLVPTLHLTSTGCRELPPIEIVEADDRAEFVSAIERSFARGNPELSSAESAARPRPYPILIAAGVKSFRAFERGLRNWHIDERCGTFYVQPWVVRAGGGLLPDQERKVCLPVGSKIADAANLVFDLAQAEGFEPCP